MNSFKDIAYQISKETYKPPHIFELLPINWEALGAIATFLAVLISFISLYFYRKREKAIESQEIAEEILKPLKNEMENIIRESSYCDIRFWGSWRNLKEKPLSYKLPKSLREDFNKFHQFLEDKQYLFEKREKLKKIINDSISKHLNQFKKQIEETLLKKGGVSGERISYLIKEIESGRVCSDSVDFYINLNVFNTPRSIDFFELIFEGLTFKEYKEKIKKGLREKGISEEEIKQNEIFQIKTDNTLYRGINELGLILMEEISIFLKEEVKRDKELEEFVEIYRSIKKQALHIEKEIKYFLKKNL